MNLETWLLFSGAALIVILIPGPLSLLMISNSLNYGLRRSYPAFLGGVFASNPEQCGTARARKQRRAYPIEPTLALAAAQVTRSTVGTQAIEQLAQQIEYRPGGDHDQQLRQECLLTVEELRKEGGKKQNVLGIAGAQYKRPAKQCAKARSRRAVRHFCRLGRLPRLLPALPGEVEQIRRADNLQQAEQLF